MVAAVAGFADSVWNGTIGVAFLYDVWKTNKRVGVAEALNGLANLAVAIPAGWAADRWSRAGVIKCGALTIAIAAPLYAYAVLEAAAGRDLEQMYARRAGVPPTNRGAAAATTWIFRGGHSRPRLRRGSSVETGAHALRYVLVCVANMLLGGMSAIVNGPVQALFADSIETGKRSKLYNWLFVCYIVPTLLGPAVSIGYFSTQGDEWRLGLLRNLILLGLGLEIPVAILLCLFRDDAALGGSSDAVQDQRVTATSRASVETAATGGDVPLRPDTASVRNAADGGAIGGAADGDATDAPPNGSAAKPSAEAAAVAEPTDPRIARIPYVVFGCDLVVALGSGMTVKYFPLFFKEDLNMRPAAVQAIYLAVPVAMAIASTLATKLGRKVGRVQAVLALRVFGLTCFAGMVVLYDRGIARAGPLKYAIVALYVVRTASMNCTYPLEESILMDYARRPRGFSASRRRDVETSCPRGLFREPPPERRDFFHHRCPRTRARDGRASSPWPCSAGADLRISAARSRTSTATPKPSSSPSASSRRACSSTRSSSASSAARRRASPAAAATRPPATRPPAPAATRPAATRPPRPPATTSPSRSSPTTARPAATPSSDDRRRIARLLVLFLADGDQG